MKRIFIVINIIIKINYFLKQFGFKKIITVTIIIMKIAVIIYDGIKSHHKIKAFCEQITIIQVVVVL